MVDMTTGLTLGVLELNGQPLSLEQVSRVAGGSMEAAIASAARQRIAASQAVVERIVTSNETAYGINTGFGKLSDVRIGPETCNSCNATWCAATPAGWASRWKRPRSAPCCCCAPMSLPKD